MAQRIPTWVLGFLCGIILVSSGCGSRVLEVEGSVEFDGVAVASGSISFEPADGSSGEFGGIITDGKYKITSPPGVEPGARKVRIRAARKTGRQIPAGSPSPPGTMVDELVVVPAKYNDSSKLTAHLEAGVANRFDFKLVSGGPIP
ncbi:MAG: hypothetical protein EXS16_15770 [Gemmataceae bacterium]|nr:hypothetical protein [Gemmataceae bacterium]